MTARRWTILAAIWITAAAAGWGWYFVSKAQAEADRQAALLIWLKQAQAIAATPPVPRASVSSVDAARIMKDVQALAYERRTEAHRTQARAHVAHALQSLGYRPSLQSFSVKGQSGVNLEIVKPGTDPAAGDLLLGAHYDTVAGTQGADDNASGVAAVMEVARLLQPLQLKQTVRFVFFDQEEVGLLGSRAYARSDTRIKTLKAVIIAEMLGHRCTAPNCQTIPNALPLPVPTTGTFIAAIGDTQPMLVAFRQAMRPQAPVFALFVPDKGQRLPNTRRSDHAPFWDRGVPAVMLTDTAELRNPHYHQPSDAPKTIDPAFLAANTQLLFDVVVQLAGGPQP
jgi:hypothetical protein